MTDVDLGWTDEHETDLRRRLRAAAERDPVDDAWDEIIARVDARRPRSGLRRRSVAAAAAGAVLVAGLLALRERADNDRVDTVDGTTTTSEPSTTSTTDPEASTSTTVTPAGTPGGGSTGGGSSDDGAGPGAGSPSGPTDGTPSGPGTPSNTTASTTTSSTTTTTAPQPSGLDCTLLEAGDHMRAGPSGSGPHDLRLHVAQVLNLAEQVLLEAANDALDGDDADIAAFVGGGWQAPYRLDLRMRILLIMDTAGPDVDAQGTAALDTDTFEALEAFLRGQNCRPEG